MIKIYQIAFIICFLQIGIAQGKFDESIVENKVSSNFNINEKEQLKWVGTKEYRYFSDNSTVIPKTNSLHGIYGDLLNDDPDYNPKAAWWKPAVQVIGVNLFVFAIDRYIFKYTWSTSVGSESWNHNIKTGWVWDDDRFGMNFLAHPYTGSQYFTSARAQGYGYFGSFPYAVEGSLLWEYFGENTLPSYNDIINTSIDGAFLGEILYRLSSNILDDRTSGVERFFREFATFIIDPKRGFDRLLQGKTWRSSSQEVYQKEPLTIGLSAGIRNLNEGTNFWNGKQNMIFNIQLDYGDPFEYKDRKPFDVFKVRGDLNFGVGRKILDNIVGYGLLTGNNIKYGQMEILYGIFQNYDYWDNSIFELATLGFTGGVMTKVNLSTKTNLYTKLHLGIAPLEAKSTVFGPDTSQYRDYNYGNGLEGSFESTLNIGSVLSFTLVDYYYYDHTFKVALTDKVTTLERNVAAPVSDKLINIFKPRLTINLFGNFRLGFEHLIYNADRYANGYSPVHIKQTEQKIYLSFSIEDFYHGNAPDNKDKTN